MLEAVFETPAARLHMTSTFKEVCLPIGHLVHTPPLSFHMA